MNSQKRKEREEKALSETLLKFQGKKISLFSLFFKWEDGSLSSSDIVKHPGAVALLPINEKDELILIRQWRKSTGEILIEIPAGTLEVQETPEECASRELQEEVGYKPSTLISLGGFYTSPGFCNEFIHLFLAKDLQISKLEAQDAEGIDVFTLSLEEALLWAKQGKIRDSKTLSALCLYKLWLSHS